MITAGYDGIYFDVLDVYYTSWAKSRDANAEQDMVDLVTSLKDYATSKNPDFKVWVNGAEELPDHPEYLSKIDGMFKEEVYYTDSGSKQPVSEVQYTVANLQKAIDAGKPVVTVEYVTGATKIADVHAQATRDGMGSYVGDLELDGINYDGVLPGQTVQPVETASTAAIPMTLATAEPGTTNSTPVTLDPTPGWCEPRMAKLVWLPKRPLPARQQLALVSGDGEGCVFRLGRLARLFWGKVWGKGSQAARAVAELGTVTSCGQR